MFEQPADYPLAVTSTDEDGLRAGLRWCLEHMDHGDHITVWTHQQNNLGNDPLLKRFVTTKPEADHVTARGGAFVKHSGPVLMAWADPNDIAEFAGRNAQHIRALCVVAWNENKLRPWVSVAQPELLGTTTPWQEPSPPLDPVVEEGMKHITQTINHSNTIAAGYDKRDVVETLLALSDAGYSLDGAALAAWAVAKGWRGTTQRSWRST